MTKKNIAFKVAKNQDDLPDGAIIESFETDDDVVDEHAVVSRNDFTDLMLKNAKKVQEFQESNRNIVQRPKNNFKVGQPRNSDVITTAHPSTHYKGETKNAENVAGAIITSEVVANALAAIAAATAAANEAAQAAANAAIQAASASTIAANATAAANAAADKAEKAAKK